MIMQPGAEVRKSNIIEIKLKEMVNILCYLNLKISKININIII
jgi:hypothetical protein